MGGIAGIIRTDGRPVEAAVLRAMANRLAHRGPARSPGRPGASTTTADARHAAQVWAEGCVGLAATDPAGWNLVGDENAPVRAVADAAFTGRADLAGVRAEAGPAMLGRLAGPFALAVWDGRRRRLLLARDRLGQRPLLWWRGEAGLAFASEASALLACPDVPRRLDAGALGTFLRFGYVPAPATGFEGIRSLPPAHYLVCEASAGRLDGPHRWWDIPRGPAETGVSLREWGERVREALRDAVRERLTGGGPVGVLLSGGLDSSILATLAAEAVGGPPRTFTARFEEAGWDESAHARAVADRLGAEHAEVPIPPECIEHLPALVRGGVLLADSSALAVHHLARQVRREAAAALSGDGGDELFGGYPRHAALWMSERMPTVLRRALAPVGRWMPPHPGRKSRWNAARRFLSALDAPPLARHLAWRSLFATSDLEALLAPGAAAEALADDPLSRWGALLAGLADRPWTDRAMAIDLLDYLPGDGLAKVDAAATAHGLEVRSPMLDANVVELARRMPVSMKWRRRMGRPPEGKRVLRETFAGVLPPRVARRGKMGFGVPVSRWLAGPYADWMRQVLLDRGARTAPLLRRRTVAQLIADHTARHADHGERLWALLCLELWMRKFRL